ncbi:DUF2798 domain-containing protein [Ferrimonas balearica]|uniref:DUF2798 domain-containing protein n=1 Tax=Ferrimonas balearica TaxID=44012 RepID=UPI001C99CB4B|nr:DUF2798 domain-containing protein [Ferrimonas balearica]MBY5991397.1 DUF2798 domain-containing protein [Ferrimonas balearica]
MVTHTFSDATQTEPGNTPLRHKVLVVAGMMTAIGGTLTGVMTYMNLGIAEGFLTAWGQAFLLASAVMMPIGALMMALLTRLAAVLLPSASEGQRNLAVGLVMAVVMESLMAFTTTAQQLGIADLAAFQSAWLSAFAAALPVGLTLMVTFSLTVKPRIERFLKS